MTEFLPMITERQGQPVTTSRAIAEQFGKQHAHVLRDIENLLRDLTNPKLEPLNDLTGPKLDPLNDLATPKLGRPNDLANPKLERLNDEKCISLLKIEESEGAIFARNHFIASEYTDAQGKSRPMYLLTRDGFTLLAMGFTGAKALQFKVAYIDAFNRMEQIIKNGTNAAALTNFEERLKALENTAGSGADEVADTVASSFLQAIQEALDSKAFYLEKKTGEAAEGEFLGLVYRDCFAIRKRTAYNIYASKVKDPVNPGALWDILRRSGVAFKEGYRCEKAKTRNRNFRAVFIQRNSLILRE